MTTTFDIDSGSVTGIGGLPHRNAADAARFSLRHMDIPAVPTLPRRSPAEGAVAQAMVGLQGITVGQYGSIAVDVQQLDPLAPIVTDLRQDAYLGFRTFLSLAPEVRPDVRAVKWQFIGPVTFGLALVRAGVSTTEAFELAVRVVRTRLQHLHDEVAVALPDARQLVFIEEPALADLMDPGFPIAPDVAIDLVSGALAAAETHAMAGLHVCGVADVPSQLAAGPGIVSMPVHPDIVQAAGYLVTYMERGGRIAWGAVSTTGPVATSADRPWRELSAVWCQLVERGVDPVLLRRQAVITPECGLASHTPSVAERVFRLASEVGGRVRDQASASRWTLGA
ncbi:MAG: hypothetical protein ACO3C1_13270 [Ilumatobacteraceae bacterium]